MSLVRYEPWNALEQLRREMSRRIDTPSSTEEGSNIATSDWVPAIDIKETDKEFLIHADIPGVEPDDIDVHMEDGMLTIKGERESETKDEREGYKRIERQHGTFYRRFSLPDTANADKITAKSKNGVLDIIIPKQEKSLARKIQVK
ncbi:MAG: Hsp20/alpha crystallin family protein [Gammaproteobacteria bacterium]|nr:MAG: Hsp20/alpha crystallin family protein [Gammaproteobacteria bacterium]